jgi:hypothetical protein
LAAAKNAMGTGFAKDVSSPVVRAWFKDHTAPMNGLADDLPTFKAPLTTRQYVVADSACKRLMRVVKEAHRASAIPNRAAQQNWTNALSSFAAAATNCLNGVDKRDQSLLAMVPSETRTAGNWLSLLVFDRPLPASKPFGTPSVSISSGAF